MVFGLAVVFDLVLGGNRFLGWLPGPNDLLAKLAGFLKARLDRTTRSPGERFMRGCIIFIALVPVLFGLGLWLTPITVGSNLTAILSGLVLALMIRQRPQWDKLFETGHRTATEHRRFSQSLVVGFADNVIVTGMLFTMGGFALLLPYRFIRALVEQETGHRAERPQSPFLRPFWPVAEALAMPGAWLAAFLIALAHVFVPGTRLGAFASLFVYRWQALPSRLWPLAVTASGLGLSFRFSQTKGVRWIGPENGRAQQTSADTRRIALILLAALLLAVLLSFMALAAAYT